MTFKNIFQCDSCGEEKWAEGGTNSDAAKASWWTLQNMHRPKSADAHPDVFHFCSVPCIEAWAQKQGQMV